MQTEPQFKIKLRKTKLHDIRATHPQVEKIFDFLDFSPANQETSAITTPRILLQFLSLHPPTISPISDNRFGAITQTNLIYLSRFHLPESTKIFTLVIDRELSENEITQIIALEMLGTPILNNVVKKQQPWTIKQKFEQRDVLSTLGLADHPKKTWAKWLGVDPRALKN